MNVKLFPSKTKNKTKPKKTQNRKRLNLDFYILIVKKCSVNFIVVGNFILISTAGWSGFASIRELSHV